MATAPTRPTPKHARDMTEAEFDEAMKRRAWRDAIATKATPQTASPNSRQAENRDPAGITSTGNPDPAPGPADPQQTGRKPAWLMTDREFDQAIRERAWRYDAPPTAR